MPMTKRKFSIGIKEGTGALRGGNPNVGTPKVKTTLMWSPCAPPRRKQPGKNKN